VGAATVSLKGTVSSGSGIRKGPLANFTVNVYRLDFATNQSVGIATPAGRTTADSDGGFNVPVTTSPCQCVATYYAVATDPQNPNVALATYIGETIGPQITVNELTTVATAYAFAQFFNGQGFITGKLLPVRVAQGFAEELAVPVTGELSIVLQAPPNADQTNTRRELGTLANMLAGCVHSGCTACGDLFALTRTTSTAGPVTTLQAMVNIAHRPAENVGALFELGESTKVYTPYLDKLLNGPEATDKLRRLDAFTVAIKFNATGRLDGNGQEECPFGGPGNLAFDPNGNAWIAINTVQGTPVSAHCQVVLKPNGHPADGASDAPVSPLHGGGLLGQGFGVGLDPSGHVWSGNFGWGKVFPKDAAGNTAGSVSEFTLQGAPLSPDQTGYTGDLCRVQGVASDVGGNIWMASWGNDTVAVFPGGTPPQPGNPAFLQREEHSQPFGVAIDRDGAAWVTNEGRSTVSKFKLVNNRIVRQFEVPVSAAVPPPESPGNPPPNPCLTNQPNEPAPASVHPKGIAIDQEGDAWAVASAVDGVSIIQNDGTARQTFYGGGIVRPWGVAVDSRDNIWVANFGNIVQADEKYGISKLCGAAHDGCITTGAALTPSTGYTLPSAGDQVLLHNGIPLYGPDSPIKSYKPLMRMTAVAIDMAGNVWAINNWKPETINDTLLGNPGGDGMVIFIGLAAPVMPLTYSGSPQAP
jgi:sugar lactone lactonase YvrE